MLGEYADLSTSQFPADAPQCRFIAAGDDKIAVLGSESSSDRQADTAGGAGDKGDLTGQWQL